ncbi:uncharacterized protein BDV17DRAFT_238958 [Aspergillus undulatus]|uniref:uncharacterized protein n=1 Tax=Aspergillus undulatus TaxID=1810928 RepID=UPI003CCE25FF
MALMAHLSSSEDELRSLTYQVKISPAAKAKNPSGSVYIPQKDGPNSPEDDFVKPVPSAPKRKLETGSFADEPSLLPKDVFPPIKKSNFSSSTTSGASSNTTDHGKTKKKPVARKSPLQRFTSSSGSSGSSIQSSLLPPTHTIRRRSALYEEDGAYVTDSDDEDREDLDDAFDVTGNERATVVFDFDRERERRLAVVVNIPEDRYTEKERSLFLQLALRGFEPLAPKHWQFDFPTLPDSLFPESGKEQSEPIIKLSKSTTFHAIKTLGTLLSLSGRVRDFSVVRDCGFVGRRPEIVIKQTIVKYIRWALFDVDLEIGRESTPIHIIHAQRKHETVHHALERLNKRLKKLAIRHQAALAETFGTSIGDPEGKYEPPLLIGFLICGPVVAIVTFDLELMKGTPEDEELDGKFFSQFDFSERGQDLWNSLAVAIVVMHIRNMMVQLSQNNNYGEYVKIARSSAVSGDL